MRGVNVGRCGRQYSRQQPTASCAGEAAAAAQRRLAAAGRQAGQRLSLRNTAHLRVGRGIADHRAGLALHLRCGLVGGVRFGGAEVGGGAAGAVLERAAPPTALQPHVVHSTFTTKREEMAETKANTADETTYLHVDVPAVRAAAAARAQVCPREWAGADASARSVSAEAQAAPSRDRDNTETRDSWLTVCAWGAVETHGPFGLGCLGEEEAGARRRWVRRLSRRQGERGHGRSEHLLLRHHRCVPQATHNWALAA